MAPNLFNRTRIDELLDRAADSLTGEWLVVGGAAAAVWFLPSRTTEDIDIIGLGGTNDERFALMTLAEENNVPIEAVNSAADFFLRRVPGWRDLLVPLRGSEATTIFRPNATLFLLLKIGRLSAVDLDDCVSLLNHLAAPSDELDVQRVLEAVRALPAASEPDLTARRERLAAALAAWG